MAERSRGWKRLVASVPHINISGLVNEHAAYKRVLHGINWSICITPLTHPHTHTIIPLGSFIKVHWTDLEDGSKDVRKRVFFSLFLICPCSVEGRDEWFIWKFANNGYKTNEACLQVDLERQKESAFVTRREVNCVFAGIYGFPQPLDTLARCDTD